MRTCSNTPLLSQVQGDACQIHERNEAPEETPQRNCGPQGTATISPHTPKAVTYHSPTVMAHTPKAVTYHSPTVMAHTPKAVAYHESTVM